MPSLKRRIAQAQVNLRKRQQDKEERNLEKLQSQRNSSLKQAGRAIIIAQAREDAKDAALQNSEAKARLNRTKNQTGKRLLASLKQRGSKLIKDIQEPSNKKAVKRKPAKRKTTAKKTAPKKTTVKRKTTAKKKTTAKRKSTGRSITIKLD